MKVISTVKYLGLVGKPTCSATSPTVSSATRKANNRRTRGCSPLRAFSRSPPRRTKSNDDSIFDSNRDSFIQTAATDTIVVGGNNSGGHLDDDDDTSSTSSSGPSSLFLLSRQLSADDLFYMDRVTVDTALQNISHEPIVLPVRHYKSLGDIDQINKNSDDDEEEDNGDESKKPRSTTRQHQRQFRRALSSGQTTATGGRNNSRRRILQCGSGSGKSSSSPDVVTATVAERRGAIVKKPNVGTSPNQIQRKQRNRTRSKQLLEITHETQMNVHEIFHGREICEVKKKQLSL